MKKILQIAITVIVTVNLAIITAGCNGGSSENRSSSTSSGDKLKVTASPSTVNAGGSSSILIEITDDSGQLVSKSPTATFSTSLGVLIDPDVTADDETVDRATLSKSASGGTATVLLTSESAGTATVTVNASGASVTVQVIFVN